MKIPEEGKNYTGSHSIISHNSMHIHSYSKMRRSITLSEISQAVKDKYRMISPLTGT